MKRYKSYISLKKNFSIIFSKLRKITSELDVIEGVTTNMLSYKMGNSYSETTDKIYNIITSLRDRGGNTFRIYRNKYTSVSEEMEYIYFLIRLGALLNPIPSGYEALKDSTGTVLKDSEGKTIYSLLA